MKSKGISLIIIIIVIAVILVLSVALILNIYKTNYQAKATSTAGYQISKDAGENWANYCSSILNTSDPLYEIVSSSDGSGY